MSDQSNYPSGSISRVVHHILTNVPYDNDPHHSESKLGHVHMAGKCSREIWFRCNVPKENQPTKPVMAMGKAIHDWLETVVIANGNKQLQSGLFADFRPRYNVVGRPDLLSSNSVGELKTSKQWAFKYLDAPMENHTLQSSIYAFYYDRPYIEIIYLARDTGQFKTFFWPRLTGIETEIERISELSVQETPPEKLTWDGKLLNPWKLKADEKSPWQCKYCPFQKECYELDSKNMFENELNRRWPNGIENTTIR
jgi:CRISPR/Cas system-associated exonuclease Cas4 (RecB family)